MKAKQVIHVLLSNSKFNGVVRNGDNCKNKVQNYFFLYSKKYSVSREIVIKKVVHIIFSMNSHTVATISEILEGQKNITKKQQIVVFLIITPRPKKVEKKYKRVRKMHLFICKHLKIRTYVLIFAFFSPFFLATTRSSQKNFSEKKFSLQCYTNFLPFLYCQD